MDEGSGFGLECDDTRSPARRGLSCLLSVSDPRGDQATKELVLSQLVRGPQTVAQLAAELGLTPPGVHRHVRDLLRLGLLAESPSPSGGRRHERYYTNAFPTVSRQDRERMMPVVSALARELIETYNRHDGPLRAAFQSTELAQGWDFKDLSLCILDEAEKMFRAELVRQGKLPETDDLVVWGQESPGG
jgi:predicted ArsR family transcriptional regulator